MNASAVSSGLLQAGLRLALDTSLAQVVDAFAARGVPYLLIKGPAVAHLLYDDPAERLYGDLDLLVPPDHFAAASAVLPALGFSTDGMRPHEVAHHVRWQRDAGPPAIVELHRTLPLVAAEPGLVWGKLSAGCGAIPVSGALVVVPRPAVSAFVAGMHVFWHAGARRRAMEDIERAVERIDLATWREAATLAQELGAESTLAAGVRMAAGGASLVAALGLSDGPVPPMARLRARGARGGACRLEEVATARGLRVRVALLMHGLVPSRAYMRRGYRLARRGRLGLAAAYATRVVSAPATLMRCRAERMRISRPPKARAPRQVGAARNLARRSWTDRRLLVRATVALAVVAPAVRLLPFRVVSRPLRLRTGESPETVPQAAAERAVELGWAISSAAEHAPWHSSCLVQALAAAFLVRRERIGATLYIGVAKEGTGGSHGIIAHAWLRCGPHVLTGGAERDRYRTLTSFEVPGR